MFPLKSRILSRSVLSPPPCSIKEMTSLAGSSEEPLIYDSVSLFQYVADELLPKNGSGFQVYGQLCNHTYTICGSGRTFIVRRWPTGTRDNNSEKMHFRPSEALKSLRASMADGPEEESLRYRSLIQELRILLHKPLATHPNFLQILSLSWELDPAGTQRVVPCITTEFAAFGTLQTFLGSYFVPYGLKRRFILDVAEGLSALHKCCITHGDVKLDNILICQSSDPNILFVAKLSDFGFSVDTSAGGPRHLVGRTPMWSAPEATERLSPQSMHLTDVYSFGFVIWSTAIDGRNPFYELENLPRDLETRMESFNFLKATNELCSEAISQIWSTGMEPHILEEISKLVESSLQLVPAERNLDLILAWLHGRAPSEAENGFMSQIEPGPLKAFDPKKIDLNIRQLLGTPVITSMRRRQLVSELEQLAGGTATRRNTGMDLVNIEQAWRFPLRSCTRQGAAAFALSQCYSEGFGVEVSEENAAHWLFVAANAGVTLAMAVCAKLETRWNIPAQPTSQKSAWLREAAKQGSHVALNELKLEDVNSYVDCIRVFRSTFWARCHEIPEPWLTEIWEESKVECTLEYLLHERPSPLFLGINNDTPLHCAAMVGSLKAIRYLLQVCKMDVNCTNSRAETPLFLACRSGHVEVALFLLETGADSQISNSNHENALHWLDSFDEDRVHMMARALVEKGARLDEAAGDELTYVDRNANMFLYRWCPGTPLHRAVARGSKVVINALLNEGADPGLTTARWSPICRASFYRMADILDILLPHSPSSVNILQLGLKTGTPNISLLFRAIRSIPKLALIYIHGSTYETALESTMSTLIRWGTKTSNLPVKGSHAPLHQAILYSEHKAAEIILQNGTVDLEVQTETEGLTPLLVSIVRDDEKMFHLLCRHGANIKSRQRYREISFSALHMCTQSWHTNTGIAKGLLECGIEVDFTGDPYSSATALVYALVRNMFDLANLLIAHGASLDHLSEIPERGNAMGEVLFYLAHRQTFYAVKFLVEHPRVSLPFIVSPRSNECVFHVICGTLEVRRQGMAAADFLPVFRLLRQKFPETSHINFQNCYGLTPLHDAVYGAYPAAVEALLADGADPTIRSSRRLGVRAMTARALGASFPTAGKTPLEMAQEGTFCEVPDHVKTNPRELAAYIKRREDVIDLFSPYLP